MKNETEQISYKLALELKNAGFPQEYMKTDPNLGDNQIFLEIGDSYEKVVTNLWLELNKPELDGNSGNKTVEGKFK